MSPQEAHRRIVEELSRGKYDTGPGLLDRLLAALEDLIARWVAGVGHGSAVSILVLVLILLALAALTVLLLRRTGLVRRSAAVRVATGLDADPTLSAAQLRGRARILLEEGDLDESVVVSLRALVRDLQERTVLEVTRGMTAHEASVAAAAAFPDVAGRLTRTAGAFDTAAYSRRHVDPKQAEDAVLLAEYLHEARPDLTANGAR